jgi:hypothetical protein
MMATKGFPRKWRFPYLDRSVLPQSFLLSIRGGPYKSGHSHIDDMVDIIRRMK